MNSDWTLRYCLSCGTENARSADFCRRCGRRLVASPAERRTGAAFMLNELEGLRNERELEDDTYLRLRPRYLSYLSEPPAAPTTPQPTAQPSALVTPPTPVASPRRAPAPRPAKPKIEGPGWLAEQQANLLLYLGAFLIVMAALVYVGFSGQSSRALDDKIKMAMLSAFTLFFLIAGLFCLRIPRVRQAGVVFFALGSLMVPINFVGAYGFFFADEDIDPIGLWLAGSICSALFYAAITYAGLGRWYSIPMVGASFSSLTAALILTNAPPEAYPGSFIALSVLLVLPQLLPPGKLTEALGPVGAIAGNAVVPVALVVAFGMTVFQGSRSDECIICWELSTRWFLPPAAFAAAIFYCLQAFTAPRTAKRFDSPLNFVALAVTGGAAVTIVYAMDVGQQWYGPAVAIVGFLYGTGAVLNSGSRWTGQRFLPWLALGAVTFAWVCFEGVYTNAPRIGAGVHLAAAAFYLIAARRSTITLPMFSTELGPNKTQRIDLDGAVALFYAAALAAGLGVFEIVSAAHHVGASNAQDATWTFFGISLMTALLAATMRYWWPVLKWHVYVVAFAMSLFVLLTSVNAEGNVTLFLGIYSLATLSLAVWERRPLGLIVPACFAFVALFAGWRYYDPNDAALPLVISVAAAALFAVSALLPIAGRKLERSVSSAWATVLQAIAFAYVVAAPITGGARLAMLASDQELTDSARLVAMHLFQTTAIAIALVAIAGATTRWWWQMLRPVIYGIALIMAVAISATSAPAEGQVIILLGSYSALAFALTLWERQPVALTVPACFAFVALLAGWRYYEPNDAALPLVLSGIGFVLFAISALLPLAAQRFRLTIDANWATVLQAIAFGYVIVAPIVGGARLAMLADDTGFIDGVRFHSTLLFQMTAVSAGLIALAGATTRWWWNDYRAVIYGIALSMTAAICGASAPAEGQVTILLAAYGAAALTLVIWERQPIGLAVPAAFGYFALIAAWRYYEPNDAYLPLAISLAGIVLFATGLSVEFARRELSEWMRPWTNLLQTLGVAYAVAAPITAWLRLSALADDNGFVGGEHFEVTALYQTAAASLALLGLLVAVRSWSARRLDIAVLASALCLVAGLLEIGHFHPDNAQAYTAPLGAYFLALALLALRVRVLPQSVNSLVPIAEVLGAALIMGPSFAQSLDADAWHYGLILLIESIGFVTLALIQRRIWLMATATTFVVMDGAHYLFFVGGPVIPNWAILALAGITVMAAGTAILLGRDRWTQWQQAVQTWWYRQAIEPGDSPAS